MKILRASLAIAALLTSFGVSAQSNDHELSGTFKKARTTGTVSLGYREASVPFSYLSARNEPIGYAIDLCRSLVDAMSEQLGRSLTIKWVPVTSESRLEAVVSGQVDLECGSTTNNAERQKQVAFSPITFVAGTKLLVKRGSTVKTFRDLGGKTLVVTAGTTNEKAMRELNDKFKLGYTIVAAKDHAESFSLLTAGKADAFATDDVLLYGIITKNKVRNDYAVVGDFLSYDPYGIMYRKGDAAMKKLVDTTFYSMADEGELEHTYTKWFLRRLPSGDRIDMPMSPQLDTIFRSMTTKPE